MADVTGDPELVHQAEKPPHRPRGFDADHDGGRQPRVKLTDRLSLMLQRSLGDLSGLAIEHRDRLLARVQIAPYNPHLGLLRPQRSAEWTPHSLRRTSSGRRRDD